VGQCRSVRLDLSAPGVTVAGGRRGPVRKEMGITCLDGYPRSSIGPCRRVLTDFLRGRITAGGRTGDPGGSPKTLRHPSAAHGMRCVTGGHRARKNATGRARGFLDPLPVGGARPPPSRGGGGRYSASTRGGRGMLAATADDGPPEWSPGDRRASGIGAVAPWSSTVAGRKTRPNGDAGRRRRWTCCVRNAAGGANQFTPNLDEGRGCWTGLGAVSDVGRMREAAGPAAAGPWARPGAGQGRATWSRTRPSGTC